MTKAICLGEQEAPPVELSVDHLISGEQDCASRFAICVDPVQTSRLLRNLGAYREWAQEVWKRCGPTSDPPPSDPPPIP